jgi:hypothetical protein
MATSVEEVLGIKGKGMSEMDKEAEREATAMIRIRGMVCYRPKSKRLLDRIRKF